MGAFPNKASHAKTTALQIGDMRGIPGLMMMMLLKLFPYNLPGNKYEPKEQDSMGNTAIACHNGRILALNEAGYPIEIKVDGQGQVSTGEVVRFDGQLKHPFTAHPKIDPDTNEMCFFGYECVPWQLQRGCECSSGTLEMDTECKYMHA